MRPGREAGLRWLRQAEHDLAVAKRHLEQGDYSDACFVAEQAGQKVLKAFLVAQGQRSVPLHSVAQLAQRCAEIDRDFTKHIGPGRILDQYYIATRYPDAIAPPAVPFESYTQDQGERAVAAAEAMVSDVARRLLP